jgi:hypothetical protein
MNLIFERMILVTCLRCHKIGSRSKKLVGLRVLVQTTSKKKAEQAFRTVYEVPNPLDLVTERIAVWPGDHKNTKRMDLPVP